MNVFDKNGNALNLLKDSDIEVGNNYAKFSNGLLVCWGYAEVASGQSNTRVWFPVKFKQGTVPRVSALPGYKTEATVFVSKGTHTESYVDIYITDKGNGTSKNRATDYIAIGKWK